MDKESTHEWTRKGDPPNEVIQSMERITQGIADAVIAALDSPRQLTVSAQIFRGTELQPRFFHRQARGHAANQDVLIDIRRKPCLEDFQTSHHGG
jgi:hypothetical protein